MIKSSTKRLTGLVLWAIAWAAVMIASAILLKGNPIKDWIQSALFIAAMSFWVWQSQRSVRRQDPGTDAGEKIETKSEAAAGQTR